MQNLICQSSGKVLLKVMLAMIISQFALACDSMRRSMIGLKSYDEEVTAAPLRLKDPEFTGQDAKRQKIQIELVRVAEGFEQITDIQFVPDAEGQAVVLEKTGKAYLTELRNGKRGILFSKPVLTSSEQGLLGLAFHPHFAENRRFFTYYSPKETTPEVVRVSEWQWPKGKKPSEIKTLLEVEQPYQNHNAGSLAFGPDGYLYVGLGDGGWAGDPHGHGQNPKTLLGSMLRLDVDKPDGKKPYGIPKDNPFANDPNVPSEVFAFGLRNPWKYSFDERGRLVVADVGQNKFEEVTFIKKGGNHGWNVKEGFSCYKSNKACNRRDFVDPIYQYDHEEGSSITGGFVVTDKSAGPLYRNYVFGDYVTGRIWAMPLPDSIDGRVKDSEVKALGKWPMLISTFARDSQGRVYVAGFDKGAFFRIDLQAKGQKKP